MRESKLVQTFLLLSEAEQEEFKAYLRMQTVARPEIMQLLAWVSDQISLHQWDKRTAWQAVFPKQSWDEKKMRNLMSSLMGWLKQFMVEIELKTEEALRERLFLAQLRKRQANQVFARQMTVNLRNLHRKPYRDGDYFFSRYEFASEANGLYGQQHVRKPDQNLQDKVHFLDAWYVGMKLKESCEMLNRQNLLATSFDNPLLPEVLSVLEDQPELFQDVPSVQVYHQIYRCLSEETPERFQALVEILLSHSGLFRLEEARGMYKHAQNFCIRQINAGKSEFLHEVFKLYQQQLNNGIIFHQDQLAHTDFKNIVRVGLKLKAFDWVESFLAEYRSKILPPHQENVYHFCLASWQAETGQIHQAIQLLQSVNFSDVYYDISARHLLLRMYIEREDWESALYSISAFSTFLRRNKQISPKNQLQHKNFLRWCKRLVNLKDRQFILDQPEFEERRKRLLLQISEADQTANREWLLEKVELA